MPIQANNLIKAIADPANIEGAYEYVCAARMNTSHNDSIWESDQNRTN